MKPEVAFVTVGWHLIIHQLHLSLILRPSHRPVFDRLQYEKIEGEGLHSPFYCVNDVISQRLTIQADIGERNVFVHVCSEQEEASFLFYAQILKTPVFEQTLKEKLKALF